MKSHRLNCGVTTGLIVLLGTTLLCPSVQARDGYRGHRGYGYHGGWSPFGAFWTGVAIGAVVASPPPRYTRVIVTGVPYYYYDGVYYQTCPSGYVVVNPPPVAVVPAAPPAAVPVVIGNTTYYYAGGVYYLPQPTGWVAVNPPQPVAAPIAAQAPAAAVAAPQPSASPSVAARSSFYQLGHDWAKDLRDDVVTRDQFVSYLKSNLANASRDDCNEFRRGFVAAYGVNGESAFDRAFKKAQTN